MRRRTTRWAPPPPVQPPMSGAAQFLVAEVLLLTQAAPSCCRRGFLWSSLSAASAASASASAASSASASASSPLFVSRVRASSRGVPSGAAAAGAAAAPALVPRRMQRPSSRRRGFATACPSFDEPQPRQQQQEEERCGRLDDARTTAETSSLWGPLLSPASRRRRAAAPFWPPPPPPPPPPWCFSAHQFSHGRLGRASGGGGGTTGTPLLAVSGSAAAEQRRGKAVAAAAASTAAMMTRDVVGGVDDDHPSSSAVGSEGRRSAPPPRSSKEGPVTGDVDLSSIHPSTFLAMEDVEQWIRRIERCPEGGVLTSRGAVHGLVHLARSAIRSGRGGNNGKGGGGSTSRTPSSPEGSGAELVERLLRACLLQKCRQLRATNETERRPSQQHDVWHYPPVDLFNVVIRAWGDTKSEAGARRAEHVFELLEEQQCDDGTRGLTGGTSSAQPEPNSLYDDDDDESTPHGRRPPRPDRRTYKSLIRAWAVARCPSGPARAEHWLNVMEERSGIRELLQQVEKEGDGSNEDAAPATLPHNRLQPPDRATYNVVLSGYARAPLPHPNSDAKTTAPLHEMKRIVDRMDRLHEITASEEYRLDAYSYQALLMACSRHVRATRGRVDRTVVRDIEMWLTRMVRTLSSDVAPPSSIASFAAATSRRRHGADRADTKDASKVVPWSWAVGVLVEALAKSKDQPRDARLAADYLRVLAGRSAPRPEMAVGPLPRHEPRNPNHRSASKGTEDYPSQECIWKVMQALERLDAETHSPTSADESRRDTIDELVRIAMEAPFPRIFFVNQAAEFWSQTGWLYAPDLVEQLMGSAWERSRRSRHTSSLKPTGQTFAIAMRAWLRCEDRDEAPHRCELLLQQMLQLHQETSDRYYRPRDEHLRSVLTCWLNRCQDGKRYHGLAGHLYPAEHIEAHLQWHAKPRSSNTTAGADDTKHDWLKNAAGHYSMAIRAWSQQVVDEKQNVDRVDRAVHLLDDLEHTVSSIPAFPCNWALEIFAQPQATLEKRKKAYDSAINTFRRGERNARTYVLMLQVLKTQVPAMDQNHRDVIEDLVKESCSSGMLTQDLIWRVVDLLNADSLQRLFGLTYQYATLVVQMRDKELLVHVNSERMDWSGAPPNSLLLRNLPPEWSCNIDRQRRISAVGHSYT